MKLKTALAAATRGVTDEQVARLREEGWEDDLEDNLRPQWKRSFKWGGVNYCQAVGIWELDGNLWWFQKQQNADDEWAEDIDHAHIYLDDLERALEEAEAGLRGEVQDPEGSPTNQADRFARQAAKEAEARG